MEVPLFPPAQSWTDGWTGLAAKRRTATHNFLSPHILIYHTTGRLRGDTHRRPPIVTKSNLILGTLNSLLSWLQTALTMNGEVCGQRIHMQLRDSFAGIASRTHVYCLL